jgi:hypothetical protein
METGTQIILQRMIDCPEEFRGAQAHKWDRIMRDAKDYLPREDVEALDEGIRQVNIDLYNERVLKALAGESEVEENIKYKAEGRYGGGFTDARGLFGGAVAKQEGAMINDHLDAHRQTIRQGLINSIGITTAHKGSSK